MSFILRTSRFAAASRSVAVARPFSSTSFMANKEHVEKSESHEKEKKGGKLSTDSEEAVHADRHNKDTIEELQKKSTEHLEKKK
ncbi:uncharacterized protein RCO7_11166 [Rhynchosporium graminicola]|uniref:Uncharacterized protein n=1 Tax=Rhynchosporium graminicola TaxID=2792576 RepID=A0A1E1K526_9HELO|nr:uncharacterized protein RCO7_11166 [Rhynchosporium commune]